MAFATAVNCMDGRVQLPVIAFLRDRFGVEYVDAITEPGPVRLLAEEDDSDEKWSILRRVNISISKHKSRGIAVMAHHDCAGSPAGEPEQRRQLHAATHYLAQQFPRVDVLGLWVGPAWAVTEVCSVKRPCDA